MTPVSGGTGQHLQSSMGVALVAPPRTRAASRSLLASKIVRHAPMALAVAAAYFAGSQIGFGFTFRSTPTSIFWLPNATMFAVFLLVARRDWWIYLLAVAPAHAAAQLYNGVPPVTLALLFMTNLGDAAIAALAVRRLTGRDACFDSFRGMALFVSIAAASPLLMSFIHAAAVVGTGWSTDYWLVWHTRFRSNTLTNIMLVPPLVIGVRRGRAWLLESPPRRFLEAAALALALLLVGGWVLGDGRLALAPASPLLYAPLPLFLWAASRFGTGGVGAALLGFALLVISTSIRGQGPFSGASPPADALALQVFLTLLAVPLLLLTALLEAQRRADRALRESVLRDAAHRQQAYQLLEQRVADRTRTLSTLLDIANTVASKLELEPLMRVVLEQLGTIVTYTGATIFIQQEADLVIVEHIGPLRRAQTAQVRLPAAGAGACMERPRGSPFIVGDLWGDSPEARAFRAGTPDDLRRLFGYARSLLVVPLRARDRPIGLLRIDSALPDQLTLKDAELAWALADQIAVAIENARLYDQGRELAALAERQRLSRELHDSVTQTLYATAMLGKVLPTTWERDAEEGRRTLASLQAMTQGALAEMRTLLWELRPDTLAKTPLGELLRQLATAHLSRLAAPIEVSIDDRLALPAEVHVAFYRIAQEALANVCKHAAAVNVHLALVCSSAIEQSAGADAAASAAGTTSTGQASRANLRVGDDGRGFDSGQVALGNLGLAIMRERAAAIGATLVVDSAPARGTTVIVEWQRSAPASRREQAPSGSPDR
jgi:two-component system nitrate/nitrite sensor histidine kinase NarX